MILLLIKYKYVYCFYLLHEEPCNGNVPNEPLLLLLLLLLFMLLIFMYFECLIVTRPL